MAARSRQNTYKVRVQTFKSRANTRTKSSGLIKRTAAKGMKRWQGPWPPQKGAHDASTRGRSQSATIGGLDGQPSTSAIPLNDTSQGFSPAAAASAANALGVHACTSMRLPICLCMKVH